MIKIIIRKIRNRETKFWDGVYRFLKRVRQLNMPVIRPLYVLFRGERSMRLAIWDRLKSFFYYEPMFKTYCRKYGRGLRLLGGIPQVHDLLTVEIGDCVTMHGAATFTAGKVYPEPILRVGSHTHLGYQVGISVGTEVTIGDHVLIANRVSLVGYDQHPVDPVKRMKNYPPDEKGCGDIIIEDYVWIGMNCIVLKGVTVGEASIVAAGSVVTNNVPPYSVVAGNPARVVKSLSEFENVSKSIS